MPFKTADVEKHNKGLNDKQKELWVRVANDAFARCEKAGESDCDASAIRQANSVAAKNLTVTASVDNMSDADWKEFTKDYIEPILKGYIDKQTFNIEGVEIFAAGIWNGDKYTTGDLDEMERAFDQVNFSPPLKLGHNSEQEKGLMSDGHPAFGWVDKIYRSGEKLLADFKEIPQKLYEALKRGNYKTVSSEIWWNYESNGAKFPRVLKAVSLLGADVPAVTSLEAIEGLYSDKGATSEGVHIYEFDKDHETKEKAKVEAEKIKQEAKKMAENEKLEKELKTLKEANETLKADKVKLTEENTDAKSKLAEMSVEVKTTEVEAFVKEMKSEGKILPSFEGEAKALLMSASDTKVYSYTEKGKTKAIECTERETLERLFTLLPKLVEFKERGGHQDDDGESGETPADELHRRATALVDSGDAKNYSEAMNKVLASDTELKKAYANVK